MLASDKAKAMTLQHEGRTSYLYLDGVGYPTIGIGNYLPTLASALALHSWCHVDGRLATTEEISAAYARIVAEPRGYRAEHYETLTDLRISDAEIDSLWDRTFVGFKAGLVRVFPAFESFPEGPSLALFDIIYQAGEGGIRHGFPAMCRAVNSNPPAWHQAGLESYRSKSSNRRNCDILSLFESGVV